MIIPISTGRAALLPDGARTFGVKRVTTKLSWNKLKWTWWTILLVKLNLGNSFFNVVFLMPCPFRIPKLFWNGPNFGLKQNVLDMGQKAKVFYVIQFFDQSKMFWLGPKTLDWSKTILNLEKEEADWITQATQSWTKFLKWQQKNFGWNLVFSI